MTANFDRYFVLIAVLCDRSRTRNPKMDWKPVFFDLYFLLQNGTTYIIVFFSIQSFSVIQFVCFFICEMKNQFFFLYLITFNCNIVFAFHSHFVYFNSFSLPNSRWNQIKRVMGKKLSEIRKKWIFAKKKTFFPVATVSISHCCRIIINLI